VKLTILRYGNPILRKKGEKIAEITDEIRQLVHDMIQTMDEGNRGIGLAAQQVGQAIKLFVLRRYIDGPNGKWTVSDPIVYINPKILAVSEETWVTEEGCLSIPKIYLPVERPIKIKIESTRLDGSHVVEEVEGMNARVILHENDHINGVLFIDRVEEKYLREVEGALRAIKKKALID
jgi:peptide deformylase